MVVDTWGPLPPPLPQQKNYMPPVGRRSCNTVKVIQTKTKCLTDKDAVQLYS